MPTLKEVNFDPFAGARLKPVTGDPFADAQPARGSRPPFVDQNGVLNVFAGPEAGEQTFASGVTLDQATIDRLSRTNPTLLEALKQEHSAQQVARDTSTGKAALISAGKSAADIGTGLRQLYNAATGNPDAGKYTSQIEADLRAYQPLTQDKPWATGIGELVGDAAATAVVPLGPAALSLRGFGTAAATNAGIAGAEFTPEGESRLDNAMVGGAFGAAGHGVIGVAGKAFNEARNLTANALGWGAGKLPAKLRPEEHSINSIRGSLRSQEEQTLFDAAAREGVPLTAPDVSGKLQSLDGLLGRLAVVGNAGTRTRQAQWSTARTRKLRDDYVRYVGGEGSDEIKEAIFGNLNRARAFATKLYDEVTGMAGDQAVLTPKMQATAAAILQKAKQDIRNPEFQNSTVVQMAEKFSADAGMNFSGARDLRSRMRQEIRDAVGNKLVGTREAAQLNRLASALESDMEDFAKKQGGMLYAKWRNADSYYRNNVVPFKDNLLAQAKNEESFDHMLEEWVKNPRRLQKVVRVADERGRDAIRLAIIDRSLEAAKAGLPGNEFISPERFARNVRNMAQHAPVLFSGPKGKELAGLTNLMRHMSAVDRTLTTPQTGMGAFKDLASMSVPAAGAAFLGGKIGAAPGATLLGVASVIRYAYGSTSGARLISAAADLRNDPKGLQYVWNSLRRVAERNASVLNGDIPPDQLD